MGVYIYTLRSKVVPLILPSGEKVRANLYSYAYRLTNYWPGDLGYVTEPLFYDTDKFPGKFVGWVGLNGSKLTLTDRTRWVECKESRPEGWVPVRYRHLLVDGKVEREAYDIGPPEQDNSVLGLRNL